MFIASVTFKYDGQIDNSFCYLDIPPEVLQASKKKFLFNIDKQYCFQTKDYLLLTPETYWYPRAGTGYSDENPDWHKWLSIRINGTYGQPRIQAKRKYGRRVQSYPPHGYFG